jgi:KDO2-lipid IV(A) lauroyltransferase
VKDKTVNNQSANDKIDKSLQFRSYLAPKYWPLWFAVGILRLSAFLPTPVVRRTGSVLGMLIYRLMPSRRRVARINIRQAFPEFDKQQIDDLNKAAFKSLGISIFEMGTAWFADSNDLKQQCEIEGKEHLDQAIAENKAVILLTGHFTTLEIGGRLIGFYCDKYNGVYKKAHNPMFNAVMVRYRAIFGDDLIETKNGRAIIRGLKKGHATWFAPDQDFSRQEIVFTPFLGGIASTLTATAKMARMTSAAIVPFYQVRLDGNKGFKLVVLPALKDFPTKDIEADSARINKTIEEMVYACPEQYLWSHKRFKTQPDQSIDFYG